MRVRLLLTSVAVLGLLTEAQPQSPPGGSPTFAARAELVTVPVIVTDNYGVHFRNLKKENFLLLEDGKPQPIVSFEEFQAPPGPPPHISTQLPEFNNHFSPEVSQAPLTILVFNMVNTPIDDQNYGRKELLKYLSGSVGSGQATSLLAITRHGIKVISDFTTDPKCWPWH